MNDTPQDDDRLFLELAQLALARCDLAATCSEVADNITRTFCSPAMAELHALMRGWLTAARMTCRLDAAGNLFGRLESPLHQHAPALLVGSHLDSVPNAGRFDGVLGVMLGLALVEAVRRSGMELPFALEVVGFSEEEGVRFGVPFIGSRALLGDCDEALLQHADANGITVAAALRNFGCNPDDISTADIPANRYFAFLEPHIEQGPVLENEMTSLSVVTAIAGQTRATIQFLGHAGHAGTVPMNLRRDALAAAAEWIGQVERVGLQTPGLVATVGKLSVFPCAGNVIPGEVHLSLDIRHTDDAVRNTAIQELERLGHELAVRRSVSFQFSIGHEHAAVAMDESLTRLLNQSIIDIGERPVSLPSGAGHDAAVMARRWPTAMLFIRCTGGVSHHPHEAVQREDVTAALRAMWHFVRRLAEQHLK